MRVILDSVIIIDYLNDIPQAVDYVELVQSEAALSVITRAEVLTGVEAEHFRTVADFLDCFPLLLIGRETADLAARLRNAHRWKLPDAFQAALAQHYNVHLATRNRKDFDPDKHDFVEIPYVL